jgi:hypothetical protein
LHVLNLSCIPRQRACVQRKRGRIAPATHSLYQLA